MLRPISFILLCLLVSRVNAQIETDRPDFTESPNVVPKGALQIETGFIYERDRFYMESPMQSPPEVTTSNITLNTTLFRYGLTDRVELRVNYSIDRFKIEKYESIVLPDPSLFDPLKGLSSTFVGIKTNLYRSERVSVGLLSHLYLPSLRTGDYSKSANERIAPEMLIPCSIEITERFGIAFQYGLTWNGMNADITNSYTLALGFGLTDDLSFYLEPFGYILNGEDLHLINGGFTYLLNDDVQLDLTGGLGLSEDAPDYFLNCGLSLLLQKRS